jgi:uncharacterized protein
MYDQAYIEYLAHFHGTRDYFECHEVLEDRWKRERPLDRESILVAFIQLAVALYHQRRGNYKGAKRILKKGIAKFNKHRQSLHQFGLIQEDFFCLLSTLQNNIDQQNLYKSVNLPIYLELESLVKEECKKLGCSYSSKSDLDNPNLIHKHIMRHK